MSSELEQQYETLRFYAAIAIVLFAVSFGVFAGVHALVKPDTQGDHQIEFKIYAEYVAEIAGVDLFNDSDIDRPPPNPTIYEDVIRWILLLILCKLRCPIDKKKRLDPFLKVGIGIKTVQYSRIKLTSQMTSYLLLLFCYTLNPIDLQTKSLKNTNKTGRTRTKRIARLLNYPFGRRRSTFKKLLTQKLDLIK